MSEHAIAHNQRVVRYGIVGLNQESSSGFSGYRKAFADVVETNGTYPAAVFSLVNSSGMGPRTFASIYNVLGLMGRLLELTRTQEWQGIELDQKKKSIKSALSGFYPNTNSISVPPWIAIANTDNEKVNSKSQENNDTDDDAEETTKGDQDGQHQPASTEVEQQSIDNWVQDLLDWLVATETLNDRIQPSSVFMGKVWPRLFFGLENISNALRPLHTNQTPPRDFATLMELFALCVINAFLVEESNYHLTDSMANELMPIALANPRSSATDFLERLSNVKDQLSSNRLPLTFILATCPLITGLISSDKSQKVGGWPFNIDLADGKKYESKNFIDKKAWGVIGRIAIQGKKTRENSANDTGKNAKLTKPKTTAPETNSSNDKFVL